MNEPFKDQTEKEAVIKRLTDNLDTYKTFAHILTKVAMGAAHLASFPGKVYSGEVDIQSPEGREQAAQWAPEMAMTMLGGQGPMVGASKATLGSGVVTPKGWSVIEGTSNLEYDLAMAKHKHNLASWEKWHPGEPLPETLASFKPHYPEPDWGKLPVPIEASKIEKMLGQAKKWFSGDTITTLKTAMEDVKTPKEANNLMSSFAQLIETKVPKNTKMTPEEILDEGIKGIAKDIKDNRAYEAYYNKATEEHPVEMKKISDIALSFIDRWNPKAREARAQSQGFTQDAYHGSKGEGSGKSWQTLEVKAPREYGFYSTAHPDLAELYAGSGQGIRPNILPLKINTNEYNVVDAQGKTWTTVNQPAIEKAIEEGKKGIVIHNVWDEPDTKGTLSEPKTVFITLDPTTVRSKFAKFSEEGIGLNNLLASGAALVLGKSVIGETQK